MPYHTPNVADGLCFSSNLKHIVPPSLRNILTEMYNDIYNKKQLDIKANPNLEYLAKQNVLLLNTALTVERGSPGSHTELWKPFTNYVLNKISDRKTDNIVIFLLWGNKAKEYKPIIEKNNFNIIYEAAHPSPFSAYNGFFGCRHFSSVNETLRFYNENSINWIDEIN